MRKRGFLLILTETLALLVEKRDWFFELLLQHIGISLISIALAALIGLSLGIAIATWRRGAKPVLALVNFVYTIPSIALFGFLIPITGIGDPTAIVALTVYALFPMKCAYNVAAYLVGFHQHRIMLSVIQQVSGYKSRTNIGKVNV